MSNKDFKKLIQEIGKRLTDEPESVEVIIDDVDYRKRNKTELAKRDVIYSSLLGNVRKVYCDRHGKKERFKWVFFKWMISAFSLLILICVAAFVAMVIKWDTEQFFATAVAFVGSVVSVITAIVAIPLIVAKYLFNPDEDKEVTTIILKMQAQDVQNREFYEKVAKIEEELNILKEETKKGGNASKL